MCLLPTYAQFLRSFAAAEKASKVHVHSNLIPRPRGAVGRRSGYNLREAMGLDENDGRYLQLGVSSSHIYALLLVDYLQRLVRGYVTEHLSIRLSIMKQNQGSLRGSSAWCVFMLHVALMKYSFFLFVRFKTTLNTFVGFVVAGQFTTLFSNIC